MPWPDAGRGEFGGAAVDAAPGLLTRVISRMTFSPSGPYFSVMRRTAVPPGSSM
jgi:hypothetical protein